MTDFRKALLAVCPHGTPDILDGFAASMDRCIAFADLTTPERLAAFIGQCAEESASFRATVEYASGDAYSRRRDLGNVEPGDGPRFKGRGLIMITGRANYRDAGAALDLPLETNPTRAAEFPAAALVAAWYWKKRSINAYADHWDIRGATRMVNGGYNGVAEREIYSRKALAALKDPRGALLQTARDEKAKASVKAAVASLAALPAVGAIASGAAQPIVAGTVAGYPASWLLIAGGVAATGAVVGGMLSTRQHQDAAQALLEAAKNV